MPRTAAVSKPSKAPRKGAATKLSALEIDKERPLVEDIRLLGRLLGEVIREQEGLPAFELSASASCRWPTASTRTPAPAGCWTGC